MKVGNQDFNFQNKTYIMGILNVTPDSFSDGGDFLEFHKALPYARELEIAGADIIDIGAESTRHKAHYKESKTVDAHEEWKRLQPILSKIKDHVQLPLSIDTYKASIAQKALEWGVDMVNDVWGFQLDSDMAKVVADHSVPVILMHNRNSIDPTVDILKVISDFLKRSIEIALKAGVHENRIILDPGIGFGKDAHQSLEILSHLESLQSLGFPILLGTSRKSFIGKLFDIDDPKDRLEETLATSVIGAAKGASIVRVHDVRAHVRVLRMADSILKNKQFNQKSLASDSKMQNL